MTDKYAKLREAAEKYLAERTIYVCDGCGTITHSPEKQMDFYRAAGKISCCPERKMIAVEVGSILAAEKARADEAEADIGLYKETLAATFLQVRLLKDRLEGREATISTLTAERDALKRERDEAVRDFHEARSVRMETGKLLTKTRIRAEKAERERDEAREERNELMKFIQSFKFTVAENSFYKDCYLHLIEPDAVSFRLCNDSTRSKWISKLEARRSALSDANAAEREDTRG